MWTISIVCLSLICGYTPQDNRVFDTYNKCVKAIPTVNWKPTVGAYSLNCREKTGLSRPPVTR